MTLTMLYAFHVSQGLPKAKAYTYARDEMVFSNAIALTQETRSFKTLNEQRRLDVAADIADGLFLYQMVNKEI